MRVALSRWYEGEYIPPENNAGSLFVFLLGRYRRHWTSRLAHWLVEFWLKEWKWIIPVVISSGALIVAVLRLS